MNMSYTKGIAFIMEGSTEKVFYRSFMTWLANRQGCKFEKIDALDTGKSFLNGLMGKRQY